MVLLLISKKSGSWARILSRAAGIVGVAALLATLGLAIYGLFVYDDPDSNTGWVGVANKTLWDWLDLLIVPIVLGVGGVVGGYLFTSSENKNAQEIAERRTQDEALQAYIDGMERLLLDEHLRTSPEDSEARVSARSRTLTVLPRLEASRKGRVVQFLYESELINNYTATVEESGLINRKTPVVEVVGADLVGADLREANLNEAYLVEANLLEANLSGADLWGAELMAALDLVLYGAIPSEDYPFMGVTLAIVVLLLLPTTRRFFTK